MSVDGLTVLPSAHDPDRTAERLIAAVEARGITVLADIDHARAAAAAGLDLRPTRVILFGNAKAGTPLMQDVQAAAIDLPLKALVWQDADGRTWLGYNDPAWIAQRHGVGPGSDQTIALLGRALAAVAEEACGQAAGAV
ncbi:uncharacterized protein (DUF302 family) [Amorphus suaedae]